VELRNVSNGGQSGCVVTRQAAGADEFTVTSGVSFSAVTLVACPSAGRLTRAAMATRPVLTGGTVGHPDQLQRIASQLQRQPVDQHSTNTAYHNTIIVTDDSLPELVKMSRVNF